MDDQRRRIIVAEIENWRKNHLLPEHYCIFLLNLYTEGDRPNTQVSAGKKEDRGMFRSSGFIGGSGSAAPTGTTGAAAVYATAQDTSSGYAVSWKMIFAWLLGACFFAGNILLAFHFNRFTTLMQIAIFSCFALFCYLLSFVFRRRSAPLTHVSLAVTFLILLLGGFHVTDQLNASHTAILLYLTAVCLFWCANGFVFGYSYLLYCGFIGLALMYGVATVDRVGDNYSWWMAELYWVPIACLLMGTGFLLHSRNQQVAGVLAVCGIIYFFGSEIQSLYITEAKRDIIQILLFGKVFASSILFFVTRSFWFQWLRL
ncbi:hypothetical protein [Brevibacillus sp. H7]|uniref:hypothetical protein n=1 Tax=Brevibacillus sp. H7 TaxID=3349138 RepID=UPI0037F67C24